MDNQEFPRLIAQLAIAVMASDGQVDAVEVKSLAALDRLGVGRISDLAREEWERARGERIDLHDTCDRLKAICPHGGEVILHALAAIATSDGTVPTKELWALRIIARSLGMPEDVANDAMADALAISEPEIDRCRPPRSRVTAPSRSRDEVVAAYRRAVERYNPEKVIHLGPEFAVLAAEQLMRATRAYETSMRAIAARELDERASA